MGMGFMEWQVDGMFDIFKGQEAKLPARVFDGSADFKTLTGRKPTDLTAFVDGIVATGAFLPAAAVIGYSGKSGGATLKYLSESKAFSSIKAIGRSPEKAPSLPKIEGVKADATDVAALALRTASSCEYGDGATGNAPYCMA